MKPPKPAKAYAADTKIREALGEDVKLDKIFTDKKIAKCNTMIEEAKSSFFDNAAGDMQTLETLSQEAKTDAGAASFYQAIVSPLGNIKGQADIFGFNLISSICSYLLDYAQQAKREVTLSKKDQFIIEQLVAALRNCFDKKITDKDGKVEKQLAELMEAAKK